MLQISCHQFALDVFHRSMKNNILQTSFVNILCKLAGKSYKRLFIKYWEK